MSTSKATTVSLQEMKRNRHKIVMLTAYDYPTAKVAEAGGTDVILVGDSLGMVVLGYDSTLPVTVDDMVHHTKAVTRGAKQTLIVTDLPFLSYHISTPEAVRNAGRLIQEGGADAVKLEGGREVIEQVQAIVRAGIPVCGHIGLQPQMVNQLGGYKVQGKDYEGAKRILEDALLLQAAGCFAIVLECVPTLLAQLISERLSIPTIGIGAGDGCDGQVLVIHDMLGITEKYLPKFAKKYAELAGDMTAAIATYSQEVRDGQFPEAHHGFKMSDEVLERLVEETGRS
ncbi:3-methyl-2-oxobutanoate hydroxymethyltransferase [Tumebacillus permanentifrigoris]|uniref:3-methyl-2-oxobutanoate hydroxymethyltransferase n=1 Tax=Tumebacillus permanentifrigoris TaxID=378543 RepID=A0A316DCV0_9BACL|nr:3-methyl-2-oxobutanoate hydroxymethyltransferase [Tumebacillus permanentifrigoris]PWK15558.1 ketopantoate hydroxymethyltransferase [Tumebacillus permanentifrigoris]